MISHKCWRFHLFVVVATLILRTAQLTGQEAPGQRPYVVTVEASAAVDGVQTIGAQLAATYGGTLAKDAGAPQDAFVLRISAEKARVLARDPRVVSVTSSRLHPMIENATEVVNWRDSLLLASRQAEPSATTTYHYHLDHLGTPRRITDLTLAEMRLIKSGGATADELHSAKMRLKARSFFSLESTIAAGRESPGRSTTSAASFRLTRSSPPSTR